MYAARPLRGAAADLAAGSLKKKNRKYRGRTMRILMTGVALSVLSIAASAPTARVPAGVGRGIADDGDRSRGHGDDRQSQSRPKDNQPIVAQSLIQLAPYNVSLEYRASVGNAAVHETEAELFYVVDGSATLVTGGKLTGESRTNAENLTGERHRRRHVAARRERRLRDGSGAHAALVQRHRRHRRADVAASAAQDAIAAIRGSGREAGLRDRTPHAHCHSPEMARPRLLFLGFFS